ncbi:keratin, type I cuticular Ha3-I-like [Octodon degus]|uniref:Keratin, type I cuticular Ha3-I-like n=1 Tax=Octodon degus TaxID=10160 RepID=A0A6P6ENK1_OCTDE|nr:keratin, type I cuticular Ha3-I-like [Octodon degus]
MPYTCCLPALSCRTSCSSRPCVPPSCHGCTLPGACNIPANVGNCNWFCEGSFNGSEKETMQFLNDRLASYLEKVRELERENAELERRIQERNQQQEPLLCASYQSYFRTIEELQQKILCNKSENSRLVVRIDNAKLAADDFRTKYETELSLRQLVESDINGLRRILDELTLCRSDLEAQVESLKEELLSLKQNHEQEVNTLRCQLGDRLNVEVDAAPSVDLNRVLNEVRSTLENSDPSSARHLAPSSATMPYTCCLPALSCRTSCSSRPCVPPSCHGCTLPGACNIPANVGNCNWFCEGSFNGSEKETMQFLNDRLASYLEKVRELERENAELERRIQERNQQQEPLLCASYQSYFRTIEELQQKILCNKSENARMVVQIDNAKLAADDFRTKYETELSLRQLVESDINGLRRILDELTLCRSDLEAQVESLKEELLSLKQNHEQLAQVQQLISSVESQLAEIRGDLERQNQEYQVLLDVRARLECEINTYRGLLESEDCKLPCNPCATTNACDKPIGPCVANPCISRSRCGPCNTFGNSLENTLNESEARYSSQLAQVQQLISSVESQLAEIRGDLERQNQEYQVLLDVRARLECEINTYRGLLESEDCKLPCNPCATTNACEKPIGPCVANPCLTRPRCGPCGPFGH